MAGEFEDPTSRYQNPRYSGKPDTNSNLSFLNNWDGCKNCGSTDDLGAYFTPHGICKDCVRKAHRKAVGR